MKINPIIRQEPVISYQVNFPLPGEGAFTGEVSAGQVADAGLKLLGRREPPGFARARKPRRNWEMNGDRFISRTSVRI